MVSFTATKTIKVPSVVSFDTVKGRVAFTARVKVDKPVRVNFKSKKK